MNSIQRWRPTKGDVNAIKMEVAKAGKYVRYADHLSEMNRMNDELRALRTIMSMQSMITISPPRPSNVLPGFWDRAVEGYQFVIKHAAQWLKALKTDPVEGDLLPPIGSEVLIHLNSRSAWVPHIVTGYYVWGDLDGNPALSRVFVKVVDEQGYPNARMLCDVRSLDYVEKDVANV